MLLHRFSFPNCESVRAASVITNGSSKAGKVSKASARPRPAYTSEKGRRLSTSWVKKRAGGDLTEKEGKASAFRVVNVSLETIAELIAIYCASNSQKFTKSFLPFFLLVTGKQLKLLCENFSQNFRFV